MGIVCMVMIANLQYGWTLFVLPMDQAHHWAKPAIQVAFTLFVLARDPGCCRWPATSSTGSARG